MSALSTVSDGGALLRPSRCGGVGREADLYTKSSWRQTRTVRLGAPAEFFAFLQTRVPSVSDLATMSSTRRRMRNEGEELQREAEAEAEELRAEMSAERSAKRKAKKAEQREKRDKA